MNIITVYFPNKEYSKEYERVLKVYEYSLKKHMPKVTIHKTEYPCMEVGIYQKDGWHAHNMHKLNIWVDYLLATKENTIVTDCDMFFTDSLEDAFNEDFDVAYTKRNYKNAHITGMNKPINGGVFFFKPTGQARRFILNWKKTCELMLADEEFYQKWFKKYAGFNQTALGYLIETDKHTKIHQFNCKEYNGCAEDLLDFDNHKPKAIHIKSPLWQIMTGVTDMNERNKNRLDTDGILYKEYEKVIAYWKELENEADRQNTL